MNFDPGFHLPLICDILIPANFSDFSHALLYCLCYCRYLHRVGRTARAGKEGYAVTFVTDDDRSLLKAIAKKAGSQLKSRIVAEKPVADCAKLIEQLEDQISTIIREERLV